MLPDYISVYPHRHLRQKVAPLCIPLCAAGLSFLNCCHPNAAQDQILSLERDQSHPEVVPFVLRRRDPTKSVKLLVLLMVFVAILH
jgi:hypothetical protein